LFEKPFLSYSAFIDKASKLRAFDMKKYCIIAVRCSKIFKIQCYSFGQKTKLMTISGNKKKNINIKKKLNKLKNIITV